MSQAAARAYRALREDILTGTRSAGSRLREEQLAEEHGLSRTPVREAIRRLQADGLVRVVPNRGAEVVSLSAEDTEEIFGLRSLLEGYAARNAALRGQADVPRLRELCAGMERQLERLAGGDADGAHDEITRLNMEFHRAIHDAGGRRLLPELLSRVIEVPLVRRTFHQYTTAELQRSFIQHRELTEAIAAGDGDWAHAVMQSHVLAARATLLRPGHDEEETQ
ncbi:GntR family transcriptional regulator [Saccharopolyspora griseoalba]|uniref:GntR family transcriptional regulator n=1 Tax=Saccharopolyspora griseoalba TaxID=1431848 RepID=A0ABW2LPD6_9PSEU